VVNQKWAELVFCLVPFAFITGHYRWEGCCQTFLPGLCSKLFPAGPEARGLNYRRMRDCVNALKNWLATTI
jgi:hypothetical protein